MIFVSWNYVGLGRAPKPLDVKDLVRTEKPQILLIKETKMNVEDVIKLGKNIRRSNKAIAEDLREAFDELCTLWNNHEVCLYFSFKIQHWILTKFRNK